MFSFIETGMGPDIFSKTSQAKNRYQDLHNTCIVPCFEPNSTALSNFHIVSQRVETHSTNCSVFALWVLAGRCGFWRKKRKRKLTTTPKKPSRCSSSSANKIKGVVVLNLVQLDDISVSCFPDKKWVSKRFRKNSFQNLETHREFKILDYVVKFQ